MDFGQNKGVHVDRAGKGGAGVGLDAVAVTSIWLLRSDWEALSSCVCCCIHGNVRI